jgi:hypothetical protein
MRPPAGLVRGIEDEMKTNWFYFSFWGSVATASKRRREALLKKVERVATRSDYPERGLFTARLEVL